MNRQTAALAIAALLLIGGSGAFGQSGGLMVGDSLLARSHGTCNVLNTQGKYYRCLTQSARFATNFELPPDLSTIDGHTTAYLGLGTNDSWFWNSPGAQAAYKSAWHEHAIQLLNAGYRLAVILPPAVGCLGNIGEVRNFQIAWVIGAIYLGRDVRLIDPTNLPFEYTTTDCLHPTPEWSLQFADYIDAHRIAWENE